MNVEIFAICKCTDVIFPIQLKLKKHPPGRTPNFPLNVSSWPSIVTTCQSFLLFGGTSAVFVQYVISTEWWRTWRTQSPSGASSRTPHGTRRCSRNGNLKFRYCEIIIVHGGPVMVAFVGNLCTQIYIPMNIYQHLLVFINKIKLTTDKIMSPQIRKILATP